MGWSIRKPFGKKNAVFRQIFDPITTELSAAAEAIIQGVAARKPGDTPTASDPIIPVVVPPPGTIIWTNEKPVPDKPGPVIDDGGNDTQPGMPFITPAEPRPEPRPMYEKEYWADKGSGGPLGYPGPFRDNDRIEYPGYSAIRKKLQQRE